MAIYHLHVKVIGRKAGSSAVASAAYRSASRLRDDRLGRGHDFSGKRGVVHSEVMLPDGAPEHLSDRERLWNEVEAVEVRKDAQLAREVEFALPREMSQAQGIALARDFIEAEFVTRGMVADLNVHWDIGEDGMPKPHAHVMLTMRSVDENGFGAKVRDWNRTELVERWRERWASHVNERLAELDIDARIDHRSLEAQGIALEPQNQIGAAAQRIEMRGIDSASAEGVRIDGIERVRLDISGIAETVADRADMHRAIARDNGARILADPHLALDAITHGQSTFTRRDMAMFAHRHSEGVEQFDQVMSAMRSSADLVELGEDGRGDERFTTRQMIETEQYLHRAAALMAERERYAVEDADREAALARSERRGLVLSGEQREALAHVTDGHDLGIVVGHAGTGKSAMLGVAREAWEAAGYEVRGAALSGIAAENLEAGSGIASRTIASLEQGWARDRDLLTSRDVLVIDEAGMVGTRQLERLLSHAAASGAKVVLVGDPQQLQSIEAGAAFRSLHERHGGAEIEEVRRQHEDWQRDATRDLASGRAGLALHAYRSHGMVHEATSREQAREELIERWDCDRQAAPDATRIILTHTNAEVRQLNDAARERMREAGDLGEEVRICVTRGGGRRGERSFAPGDRVMFLQNERSLGVKNGTLGTIEEVSTRSMTVRTDDGRSTAFDFRDYDRIDHGYAATIHKAQGMTVDRTHVLATPGLDAHGSYVALSRHREGMDLHYGRDDFTTRERLVTTLSRDRAKDMASDYERHIVPAQGFAERRGITFRERVVQIARKVRDRIVLEGFRDRIDGMVDGFRTSGPAALDTGEKLGPEREDLSLAGTRRPVAANRDAALDTESALRDKRTRALIRHARAVDAIFAERERSGKESPPQTTELHRSRDAFDEVFPQGSRDAEAAYLKDTRLAREAAHGRSRIRPAIAGIERERELRTDPQRKADRFIERWNELAERSDRQYAEGFIIESRDTRKVMAGMLDGLHRDPQLESVLEIRKRELGLQMDAVRGIRHELSVSQGLIGMGRGRGVGLQGQIYP